MDFNVNVNVKFDATPALVGVVSALTGVLKPVEVLKPTVIAASTIQVQETQEVQEVQEQKAEETPATVVAQSSQQQGPEHGEITDEMLRKIVGPKSKDKGKEAVFTILDEFGVKRVPDLKQEQRQAFIDKLSAL